MGVRRTGTVSHFVQYQSDGGIIGRVFHRLKRTLIRFLIFAQLALARFSSTSPALMRNNGYPPQRGKIHLFQITLIIGRIVSEHQVLSSRCR